MKFEFKYNGGHFSSGLKFYSMLLVGGREEFIYNLEKCGQVIKLGNVSNFPTYQTDLSVVKIFLHIPLSHGQKITQSYYIRFEADCDSDRITIVPPDITVGIGRRDCYFECYGRFLSREDTLKLLDPDSPSVRYVKTQRLAPRELLKTMITIKKVAPVFEGRRIALCPE